MAHELEFVNGVAQMAYVGAVPWHGLGTKVDPNLTPEEMMQVAGLDWSVEKQDVFYKDENGEFHRAPKKQALVRSNDGKYLDIVSDAWKPVQNADAFDFFAEYVSAGNMTMHTAGSLKDGQIIWGLAKVEDSFELFGGKDKVDSYLLLSNPHQFGRGVDVRFTPIRVVCNNTLSLSLESNAKLGISLNHRNDFDVEKVKLALDEASKKMTDYKEMAEFLSTRRYTQGSVFEYFTRVFPKTTGEPEKKVGETVVDMLKRQAADVSRNATAAMDYMNVQPGAEYGEGTWWQAYNTVTFMTNHVIGRNNDTRLQSTWFGQNKDKNVKALGLALEMADVA